MPSLIPSNTKLSLSLFNDLNPHPSIVAEHPLPSLMEPEKGKQSSNKTPYTELEQVNSDFILAIALQEQEGTFTMLTTMESEESSNEDESGSSFEDDVEDGDVDDFSESQEFELGDLQLLEGEGSNDDDDEEMEEEEDEIDPDEMSYEELIELAEFVGEERRGLSPNEIPSCLHPYTRHFAENKTGIDRCVICQVEYEEGEALMALPCEHPYHSDCITKWLQIKKVCPICSCEVSTPKLANNVP
ncbi:hypothetical protein K1719_025491 [Acacia pycnantha]|nr:hypothetical protein K1719_025491 [Acacia pycnantha]